jgi:transitional endoplasmic reticulum ATPase
MARELIDWHVFEVHASEVIQNPKRFRDTVELAQTHRPSIVFLDEADELLANRNGGWNASATNEILKCMDGFSGKVPEVLFVAATNRLEAVDPAALRGGRFSETLFMDLLRGSDLVAFVQKQLECMPQVQFARDVTAKSVATLFGEAAPADVVSVLKKAVNRSFVGDCQRALTLDDFRAVEALRRIAKE